MNSFFKGQESHFFGQLKEVNVFFFEKTPAQNELQAGTSSVPNSDVKLDSHSNYRLEVRK